MSPVCRRRPLPLQRLRAGSPHRVLFCAPAGARRGFGHLLRCRALARALGVRPLLCVRGARSVVQTALGLGCDVAMGSPARVIAALRPDLVVVDDPIPSHGARLARAARRAGAVVASVHDLGLGYRHADFLIDGSVVTDKSLTTSPASAIGPAFAILDPSCSQRRQAERSGIVVSLGGGRRTRAAAAIADAIARLLPDVAIRVVGGFSTSRPPRSPRSTISRLARNVQQPNVQQPNVQWPNVQWIGASTDLTALIAKAEIAVVGGGVTLYEACAVGAAAVAVAVVAAQKPTVAAFVARGAALGRAHAAITPQAVAADVVTLFQQRRVRERQRRRAVRLIDGRGAGRAAARLIRFFERTAPCAA